MYKDSIQARREIARNFTALNYRVDPALADALHGR